MDTFKSHNNRFLESVERFFVTWRFPFFMLLTLFLFWVLIMVIAFMPTSGNTAWGAFAEDFKRWCFGYDPETGSMDAIYLITFTTHPIMLAAIILWVWKDPLAELRQNLAMARPYALISLFLVGAIASSLPLMYVPAAGEQTQDEFRPEALRTTQDPPLFTLTNADGEQVSLNDYRGDVVLLTSIYASCGDTCPVIMQQARDVLRTLNEEQREEVVLMAITMDPERDTPEMLGRLAEGYRLGEYGINYHMLTGEPGPVNRTLDRLDVARKQDTQTGEIMHTNLFLLVDRQGNIAYRFTLGDRQAEWMREAAELLIEEEPPTEVAGMNE